MAHDIAIINGQAATAYQGETPWHNLGTRVDSMTSIAQAMAAATLDWTVEKQPVFLADGRTVPNRHAVVRDVDSAILGTVSDQYSLIQNSDAFEVFQSSLERFGMTVETAGALGRGERIWMLFKMPVDTTPVKGDDVRGYGLALTSHDGSWRYSFLPTWIRVVCKNTLQMATGARVNDNTNRIFGIRHVGDVDFEGIERQVESLISAMVKTGETFASLAAKRLTPRQVVEYITAVFPAAADGTVSKGLAERRREVADLVWTGVGADLAGSDSTGTTAWAAYNAVTEFFDHVVTGSAKSAAGKTRANVSAIFGTGARTKVNALKLAERLLVAA